MQWQDRRGRTALHVVTEELSLEKDDLLAMHSFECYKILREHGADENIRDSQGRAPAGIWEGQDDEKL